MVDPTRVQRVARFTHDTFIYDLGFSHLVLKVFRAPPSCPIQPFDFHKVTTAAIAGGTTIIAKDLRNFDTKFNLKRSENKHEAKAECHSPVLCRKWELVSVVSCGSRVGKSLSSAFAPTGEARSTTPTGEARSTAPLGEARSTTPTGEARFTTPTGEVRSTTPTGEARSTTPTGEARFTTPTGEVRSTTPTGEVTPPRPTEGLHLVDEVEFPDVTPDLVRDVLYVRRLLHLEYRAPRPEVLQTTQTRTSVT